MRIEDFKEKINSLFNEGADIAAITDELFEDYSERIAAEAVITEKENVIAALTAKIAEINETNMKLVNRIKYSEAEAIPDETPEVTIENLFD